MSAKARPQLSLKGRALRYLSQREHSRAELARKLAPHAQDAGEVSRVLDELQSRGFIDHQRVAESVVHRRSSKLGVLRIKQELQAIGIEPQHAESALEQLRATELQRARDVWRRKFDGVAADAAGRAKQARFLAARGFGGDVIRKVLLGDDEELQ
jgi:regulatory protein